MAAQFRVPLRRTAHYAGSILPKQFFRPLSSPPMRITAQSRSHQHTSSSAPFSTTPYFRLPAKDSQDRSSLKPRRSEETQSGTDAEAAEQEAAFDPSTTSPESELKEAREESTRVSKEKGKKDETRTNPLEVSGANPDVSSSADPEDQVGVTKGVDKGASKRVSPKKGRKTK
ncbi:hypothetical protein AJ80_00402 [Polytolypa hystricis UAMH7299]|uniref:Uncharacterized protein n=1 Tax=Polytolypa hystricis (strain UAMH7299) TaxID=1447883 RepID=A0A2B7Z460_POLH7|nr:hypothetical protein AJ80_00402 [Polytolypa hystricis UAMH7299]